jgi:hypothetical protein
VTGQPTCTVHPRLPPVLPSSLLERGREATSMKRTNLRNYDHLNIINSHFSKNVEVELTVPDVLDTLSIK